MLTNYLKIALRAMLRNKSFSLINIGGLAIGLVTFLAISLYVVDEFSFDRFHEKKDRIYRAVITAESDGQTLKWGAVPNLVAPTAAKEIPEVEKATRVFHHNFGDLGFVSTDKEKFSENELFYADPEVFDIFTISLLKGNKATALSKPGQVIISESAAQKYFGNEEALGNVLTVDNKTTLEVTGIFKDFPVNSFLQCKLIASFSSNWFGLEKNQNWGNASFDTYFLLNPSATQEDVEKKIEAMLAKNINKEERWFKISLQPLLDIRLFSGDLNANFDRKVYGDFTQVKILIGLALAIILIAAINYMNLTTAQAQKRNKEVGVAKTLGASFGQLSLKFYFEASVFVLLSMLAGLVLFTLLLPLFNEVSGKSINTQFFSTELFWISFAVLWFFLTMLSGLYPAFYLSSLSPKSALQKNNTGGHASIRKGLVVFQFTMSIVLAICSIGFFKQMNFISNKKLGYEPEQVIAVMVSAAKDREQVMSLKTEFESLAEVSKVARSQSYPSIGTSGYTLTREGTDQSVSILTTRATHEITDVLGVKLLAGKSLPENKNPEDTTIQVLLNKAAVDYLGYSPEEAIGRNAIIFGGRPAEIVGVTEDFHFTSMHQKIGPYCFNNSADNGYKYLLVEVQTQNFSATIQKLKTVYEKNISSAFEYQFLDDQMERLYTSERRLANVVLLFAGLAIMIACLGLYALAAFTAEQRTKEIGIRKVMGASVGHLVGMLSKDFLVLVLIAFVIGIPVGYHAMGYWLRGFAYKTNIDVMVFAGAGLVSILIAWVTVSFESFKAARANPVESLRSE
jgi:putative ABC transport system permease protein